MLSVCYWQRQFSSAFSELLLIPDYHQHGREKSSSSAGGGGANEMTSSQVLVADSSNEGVDTLWIVAPICIAVVFILVLALIIVLTR